jgi:hypothetical protein
VATVWHSLFFDLVSLSNYAQKRVTLATRFSANFF